MLRDSLTAERDAAAATAAVARSELEAKAAAEVAAATSALGKQWQARLDEATARHTSALKVRCVAFLATSGCACASTFKARGRGGLSDWPPFDWSGSAGSGAVAVVVIVDW